MKVRDASQIKAVQPSPPADAPKEARERRERTDRVSTDESAKVGAVIAEAAQGAGAARAAKLQAIESAVRQGTYRPDPHRIAQQILSEAELSARVLSMLKK